MAVYADVREPLKVFVADPHDATFHYDNAPGNASMLKACNPLKVAPCFFPPGLSPPPGLERERPLSRIDATSNSTWTGSQVSYSDSEPEIVQEDCGRTTLKLTFTNMAPLFSRAWLVDTLNRHGLMGRYNLVYVPLDFQTGVPFGWTSVNFVDSESADLCMDNLHNFIAPGSEGKIEASVDCDQGYEILVEKFRNMSVMHTSVPDEFKPVAFAVDGSGVPFPAATARLRFPRNLRAWVSASPKSVPA